MKRPDLLLVWEKDTSPFLDVTSDSTLTSFFLTEKEGTSLLDFFVKPDEYFENACSKELKTGRLTAWIEPNEDVDSGFNLIIDFDSTRLFIYNTSPSHLKKVAQDCLDTI